MVYRVVSLGTYPQRLLAHIRAARCVIRLEDTAVRGDVAFVGQGRVWAVGTLRDVKPATCGKDAPQGFLWCFDGVREVELVKCQHYDLRAMFDNGAAREPQFLDAGAHFTLAALFAPKAAPIASAFQLPDSPMPPDYQLSSSAPVSRKAQQAIAAGQIALF